MLIDEFGERSPAIHTTPSEAGDDPDKHRWRAWWGGTDEGKMFEIYLQAYPVMKLTPTGAWIDPYPLWGASNPAYSDQQRWVSDDGAQAWAKPTQEKALHSLAVRLCRWSQHLHREVYRARAAHDLLQELRPDYRKLIEPADIMLRDRLYDRDTISEVPTYFSR